MNLTKLSVHRPIATFMGVLVVLVFGILSLLNINIDMMPNMDIPILVVNTQYDGAGSVETEKLITEPLEGILGTVQGIKNINSVSNNGSSNIIVEFVAGTDINMAAVDVREKIDIIENVLPENATEPMIIKVDMNDASSIIMDVTSDVKSLDELQVVVEDSIIPRIKQVNGIADVQKFGGLEKEILITLQQDKMRGYGISEQQIQQTLRSENLTLPAGTIKQGNKNLPIRVNGEFKNVDEISNIPLKTSNGQTIYLRDIATVSEQYKDISSLSYTNGEPSITLVIRKQSTANTVDVSKSLHKELEKISKDYEDIQLNMFFDPGVFIQEAISGVAQTALIGVILATIILFIFLKDIKITAIVAVAMPLSIIATFNLMYFTDMTINMLSLGGLTLGIGMLVDNSIVVIESIFRRIENGESSKDASINGTKEVSISIIASTLTTIVVFLPITFTEGITSQLFKNQAYTISFSLLSSLLVALTFVPMASAILFKNGLNISDNVASRSVDKVYFKMRDVYKGVLNKALNNRKKTYIIVTIFTLLTFMVIPMMGSTFIPEIDEGFVQVNINFPLGTVFEEAIETTIDVVNEIKDFEEVEVVNASVENRATSSGNLNILLVNKQDRDKSAKEIAIEIDESLKDIPGAEINVSSSGMTTGGFGSAEVVVYVRGDEISVLEEICNDFIELASQIEGTGTATSSIGEATEQANIKIDRNKASAYGLNSATITSIISTAIDGSKVTTFKQDGTELDVVIKQDAGSIEYINDLQNILIPSPYGISVPLYEIADIEIIKNPASITRENQQKYFTVNIPVTTSSMGEVSKEFKQLADGYIMPDGYMWEYGGSTEEMQEVFTNLFIALIASILLVYMVMAANFESLVYPIIVMFSIPIAISGAFFGLFLIGEPISITSFVGTIMLSGIVINNAIVLIDYTNILVREENMNVTEALLLAGETRLRPILMSTLTTVLGLIPMVYSNASGSEFLRGLSTTVISGLIFSTVVTLVLIPTVYLTVNVIKEKRKEKRNIKKDKKLSKA